MNKWHPMNLVPVPLSKMTRALTLTVGLSTVSMHAWPATIEADSGQDLQASGVIVDETTDGVLTALGGGRITGDATLNITAANGHGVRIEGNGSVTLNGGSITLGANSGGDGGTLYGPGSLTLNGTSVRTNSPFADGVQFEESGGSIVLNDVDIAVNGTSSNAVRINAGTAGAGNGTKLTVSGGRLSSALGAGIRFQASAADVSVSGGAVIEGENALHLSGGDLAQNVITVSDSTLIGTTGSAIHADGVNSAVTLNNTTVSSRDAHAILVTGGTSVASNQVTINGSRLATQAAAADIIRTNGGAANISINNDSLVNTAGYLLNAQNSSLVNLAVDGSRVTGNIMSDATSTANVSLRNNASLNGEIASAAMTIDGTSRWNTTASSDLTSLTLDGGRVNFQASTAGVFKTVTTGTLNGSGGTLRMHLTLDGDGAAAGSDLLHVTGNSTGTHVLDIVNTTVGGRRTAGDGIRLVQVDGTSSTDNFRLAVPLMADAYEYMLRQGGTAGASAWYLRSQLGTSATAYRPAVAAYSMTPSQNLESGFSALGRFQERASSMVNNQQGQTRAASRSGAWGNVSYSNLKTMQHGRFTARDSNYFAQFGKDLLQVLTEHGSEKRAGVMFTLQHSETSYNDIELGRASLPTTVTGSAKSVSAGIGGYWTHHQSDGSYLDLVGQASWYTNKYKDRYGVDATQKNGLGWAMSAEVGKPVSLVRDIHIEPQAQLAYQYLHLRGFADRISSVSGGGHHALRGRLGFRLFNQTKEDKKMDNPQPYLSFNVLHDLLSPRPVTVGNAAISADKARTWAEVGIGLASNTSKNSRIFFHIKYQQQLGASERTGVNGELGYRINW